jgi:heavy metal sensor kinase
LDNCSLRTRFLLWSFLAEALLFGGGALFWLRSLADPLTSAVEQPSALLPGIALLVILLLALTAVQWALLGRGAAPVHQLAERIGQVAFNERLKPAGVPVELIPLVEGYNATLDRLEQTVIRTMQFSAVASHELRTPLTVLRGEIEIALRHSTLDEEMRSLLVSNLEEISRMSRIIEDLLLLSKSDIGEIPLRLESLELNELLTDLFAQAAVLGEEKDIAVRYYPSPEQIMFQGDSLRLRQLFLNLLSNAIKYTPAGGAVDITLVSEGGDALVSIKDTGIGIDAEHLAHIFERFYRVDKLKNQGDGGSGLGLSIAEWVVEAHGGEIKVNSVIGEGTEFIVKLPLSGS